MNFKTVVSLEDMKLLHREMNRIYQNKTGEGEMVQDGFGGFVNTENEMSFMMGNQQKVLGMAKNLLERYLEFEEFVDDRLVETYQTFISQSEEYMSGGRFLGDDNFARLLNLTSALAYNTMTFRRHWLLENNYWDFEEMGVTSLEEAIRPTYQLDDGRINKSNASQNN